MKLMNNNNSFTALDFETANGYITRKPKTVMGKIIVRNNAGKLSNYFQICSCLRVLGVNKP